MRKNPVFWLGGAVVVGLTLLALVVVAAPARSASPAGFVRVATAAEPKSLDPHVTTSLEDFRILSNVYEGLVRFAPGTLGVEPALAASWTVSQDGTSLVFRLRRGVRFHDGTSFDAEAVKFNLERLLDEHHPFHDTGPFPLAFFLDSIREVTVLDAHRVRLSLNEPFAPLLANLAYPIGFMVSPAAVKRWGKQFGRHGCGTGPFAIERWAQDRAVTLERNDHYWAAPAKLERAEFRTIVDPMTRIAELRAGGIDVLPEVPADALGFFRHRAGYGVLSEGGPHVWFLILNTKKAPFDDARARRAVNLAVDKQRIVDRVLEGTATVAPGAIPAAFGDAHDPGVRPYPHDPERAKALLAAAGVAPGTELSCLIPKGGSGMLEPELMATAIQADLAKVGLVLRIRTWEWNAYLKEVNPGLGSDVDMAAMAWMTNDPDTLPYLALRSGALPPKGFNSGYYRNPRVDELVEAARREGDPARRSALYRKLDRVVHDDAPWLFVASWKQNVVFRERVLGLALDPTFWLRLRGASTR